MYLASGLLNLHVDKQELNWIIFSIIILRVPTRYVRGFLMSVVISPIKHCLTARWTYAANMVGMDIDMTEIKAASLNRIL
jgi:thymidine phosphorylase